MERYLVLGCHGKIIAACIFRASMRKGIGTALATAAKATAAAVEGIDRPRGGRVEIQHVGNRS